MVDKNATLTHYIFQILILICFMLKNYWFLNVIVTPTKLNLKILLLKHMCSPKSSGEFVSKKFSLADFL